MCDRGDESGVEHTMPGQGRREETGPFCSPNDRDLRRALKATTKQLKRTRAEAVQRLFEDYVSQLEGRIREGGQFG